MSYIRSPRFALELPMISSEGFSPRRSVCPALLAVAPIERARYLIRRLAVPGDENTVRVVVRRIRTL